MVKSSRAKRKRGGLKILLGADQAARDASIRLAATIASHLGARIEFWMIFETIEELRAADPQLERERAILASVGIEPDVVAKRGFAAEILGRITPRDADMIILALRGRRGLKLVFPRFEAAAIIRSVQVPILAIWGDRTDIRRMLFCTGGSRHAEAAIRLGSRIAAAFGAECTVLYVAEPEPYMFDVPREVRGTVEEVATFHPQTATWLKRAQSILTSRGLRADIHVVHGDPAEKIIEAADTHDYDFIVMSSHGMGVARRFFLGSVADRVVKHSHIPVLVVRAKPPSEDAPDR